jgi:crotonobetainyl-CoA:carnitine CoA-transferase CaiB-like acyl-CoA transferase
MGLHAAIGILVADRHRNATGAGSLIRLALSDVAFAMVGNLGRLAQARLGPRLGSAARPTRRTATISTARSGAISRPATAAASWWWR